MQSLQKRIEEDLNKIGNNRKLVRSFFCAKTVVYAKN